MSRLSVLLALSLWTSLRLAIAASLPAEILPRADPTVCKLAAGRRTDLSLGFGPSYNCVNTTGTLNAFMFFVDFPDQTAGETTQSLYNFFLPASEWYTNSSYGKLTFNITADTSRFYRMPSTAESYNFQRSLTSRDHQRYIQDAVDAYNAPIVGADVLYIVATRRATKITMSPTSMGPARTRSGTTVSKTCVTVGNDAYTGWNYKVLNHETGHTMCLPDLYPVSGPTGQYVGGWDMMGFINGPSPDYFAWSKWKLGWLADSQIGCVSGPGTTTHNISPLEVAGGPGDIKAVVIKRNDTTVLVAEVRSAQGVNSGANGCATGLLLYTVSISTNSGMGPIRVVDANPRSGGCRGDELNDAALTLSRTKSFSVPGWGVTVDILAQSGSSYSVQVDVQ
jgi:M6 family metalloprotease-like protein